MRIGLFIAVSAGALTLAGCGSGYGSGSSSSSSTPSAGSGGTKTVALSAREFSFDPGTIKISQPGTYTFDLTNDGSIGHALEVEGQGVEEETGTVAPGSSGSVKVTFSKTGTYEFYCPVDGHRGQGMEGTLTVGTASAGAGTTEDNGGSTDTGSSGGYGYG